MTDKAKESGKDLIEKKKDEEGEVSPFFDYLKSIQGHEVLSRIVGLIEGLKKATLDKNAELSTKQLDAARIHRRNTQMLQGFAMLTVVTASTVLVCLGKFEPTVGVLFGTIMGYIFGKRAGLDS